MDKVFHLVYLSHAKDNITYSDIQNILHSAIKNNQKKEISGLLIFREGFFLQLLEGAEPSVMETVSRVIQDRRHHHFQTIIEFTSNLRI
ncbi:MAG: BLUF domain-containing protein, partial [Bdellovibrionales bacterium]|nr:BLUF domain-containing protein [Bdellovibrionales bacterium]